MVQCFTKCQKLGPTVAIFEVGSVAGQLVKVGIIKFYYSFVNKSSDEHMDR
ncbi:hypothetical protein Hanom_Chr06g00574271 [Helianthus anomalus]